MWLKRLLIIWIDKEMKYYILLLGLCLLGCNSQPSKQDKSIQPVIQKDDKFTNHYELPLTESEKREVLHYSDSVLQVKGIKLIDYRNEIYQYGDIRFYWNKKFNYFLAYPDSLIHGKEAFLCDGNHFYNKDSTIVLNTGIAYYDVFEDDYSISEFFKEFIFEGESISYKQFNDTNFYLKGKNKTRTSFIRIGIYREIYNRKILILLELEYKDCKRKDAEYIWNTFIKKKFPNQPFV
ncbi:hypothetical protein AAA096_10655 [Parabacteroides merdae]